MALAAVLAGCSQVPDYANPVEWYHGVVDAFSDEEEAAASTEVLPEPEPDQPFPSLGTVPEAPAVPSSEDLASVREGLIADREHARYTEETIRREIAPPTAPQTVAAQAPSGEPAAPPPSPPSAVASAPAAPTVASAPQPPSPAAATAVPAAPAPALAAPAPAPSAPQPAPVVTAQPAPAVGPQPVPQPAPQPLPVAAVPAPAGASAEPVDVRDLFTSLFSASGPQAVAPAAVQVASAAPPLPGTAPAAPALAPSAPVVVASPSSAAAVPSVAVAPVLPLGKVAEIHFANGSAALSASARKRLREVAERYRQRGGGPVRVVGHASMRTAEMPLERHQLVNFDISLKRAKAAAEALIAMGVAAGDVTIEARSDKEPIYWEWMPSGEAGNRRVEVFLE